jgi:hypothetical protein
MAGDDGEQAAPLLEQSSKPADGSLAASATSEQTPAAPRAIGKIERVPLREVWKHEALNLTTWLEENIDVLNSALDLDLINVDREQAAGAFSVDLVAEDETGGAVVIENQLERSNHDHLGKLITYTAFMEARAAIWIVSDPRPEHVRAISWLNEGAGADFYLVKIEGIRIGTSLPAPLLTLIVGPSEESREVGEVKKERAERYGVRRKFWTGLLERAKERTRLHSAVSPGEYGWIGAGSGKSGLTFNYTIGQHRGGVELYIDRGRDTDDENMSIFHALAGHRAEIEAAYGGELSWELLEGKRACRITERFDVGGYRDEERWSEVQEVLADAMARLEKALRPHIARLT